MKYVHKTGCTCPLCDGESMRVYKLSQTDPAAYAKWCNEQTRAHMKKQGIELTLSAAGSGDTLCPEHSALLRRIVAMTDDEYHHWLTTPDGVRGHAATLAFLAANGVNVQQTMEDKQMRKGLGVRTGIPDATGIRVLGAGAPTGKSYPAPDPYREELSKRRDTVEPPAPIVRPSGPGRYAPIDPYAADIARIRREQEKRR